MAWLNCENIEGDSSVTCCLTFAYLPCDRPCVSATGHHLQLIFHPASVRRRAAATLRRDISYVLSGVRGPAPGQALPGLSMYPTHPPVTCIRTHMYPANSRLCSWWGMKQLSVIIMELEQDYRPPKSPSSPQIVLLASGRTELCYIPYI